MTWEGQIADFEAHHGKNCLCAVSLQPICITVIGRIVAKCTSTSSSRTSFLGMATVTLALKFRGPSPPLCTVSASVSNNSRANSGTPAQTA